MTILTINKKVNVFYWKGRKMQLFIICIVYAVVAIILCSCAVKNFFKMKTQNSHLHRQYFFTVIILLFILLISFIAILLKLKADVVAIGDTSSSGFLIGYSDEPDYSLIALIGFIILGIGGLALFDRFFLKRRSKTEQEYRTRRRFAIGILIFLITGIAAVKLMM